MASRKKGTRSKRVRTVVRDSFTGRFLPKSAAKRRPKTTITERIRSGRRRTKARQK